MSQQLSATIAVIGVDIGKNSFHVVGLDQRGAIVLRQKWSRGQVESRLANMPPCLIGMEACVGAHHLGRKLKGLGHDARLMPAKYVRPYSKGQKDDFRDAEATAEAVQRPTMKFVATKTAGRLDLEALRSPPMPSREPRRLLSSTPFQSSSGECRLNAIERIRRQGCVADHDHWAEHARVEPRYRGGFRPSPKLASSRLVWAES
jgi:hypothetical protein